MICWKREARRFSKPCGRRGGRREKERWRSLGEAGRPFSTTHGDQEMAGQSGFLRGRRTRGVEDGGAKSGKVETEYFSCSH